MKSSFYKFLVRANANLKEDCITKDKVYLAYFDGITIYGIWENDKGTPSVPSKEHFDKLEFIDIWELKRNGKSIPG